LRSDLEDSLKREVLDGLAKLRRAIHDYQISGIGPLKDALKNNITTVVLTYEHGEPNKTFKEYVELIKDINAVITLAKALALPVAQAVIHLLSAAPK
jgi:hypothetical protein